jgi:TIR domain
MSKIVISYRRADSEAMAGRIRDRLANEFGEDSVFMDIDSIPIGVNFRDYIAEALKDTDILLVIIGQRWLGDQGGRARIQNPTDPVRVEVETAFQLKIPLWPVLINDTPMPSADELPPSLQELPDFNAAMVESGRDFHMHMERLIRQMKAALGNSAARAGLGFASPSAARAPPSSAGARRPSADDFRPAPAGLAGVPAEAKAASAFKRTALPALIGFAVVAIAAIGWLLVTNNRTPEAGLTKRDVASVKTDPGPSQPDPALVKTKTDTAPVKTEASPIRSDAGGLQGPKKITLASIDGVSINLPTPATFCDLTAGVPADQRMLTTIGSLLEKSGNKLLGMSADCEQLLDWRDSKRSLLDDYAQYQTQITQTSESAQETCATLRTQGDQILANQVPDIKTRVETTLDKIKINQVLFIGVLGEDARACYAGMLQKLRTEVGTDKTQAIVFAITRVKSRTLFAYRFAVYQRWNTFDDALAGLKGDVAALFAANQ